MAIHSLFMIYFLIFIAAFAVSLGTTPLAQHLARRWGFVAEPGGRRRHEGLIPKLGGLPLVLAYLVGIGLVYWLLPPTAPDDVRRLRGVVLGTLVMCLGGFVDDRWELRPFPQFTFQFLGAAIAIAHIIFIEVFTNPLPTAQLWQTLPLSWFFTLGEGQLVWISRPLALLVTLLWVVGMINAINWLDGLDGLATGVGAIAFLLFAWHGYSLLPVGHPPAVAAFPLALAGALLGFLPFNFAPAHIFLGTGGVWLLAYNLATLSILAPAKYSTAFLVLALPVLDGLWIVIQRLWWGQSPLRGDRRHLHFRLSDSGLSTRTIVLGYYGVALVFGLVAVFARSGWAKLLILLVLATAVFAFLLYVGRSAQKQPQENG